MVAPNLERRPGRDAGGISDPASIRPAADQYPQESISLALDQAAASVGRRAGFERARDALQAALHKTRKARARELEEVTRGLANADRAEEYQQCGDLLLANQRAIAKGQESVTVVNYYLPAGDDGQPAARTIALDPALSVRENAERFYKRARKARDSAESLRARQSALEEEIASLTLAEVDAAHVTSEEEVATLRERVGMLLTRGFSRGRPRKRTKRAIARRRRFEGHKFRTFRSVNGWEILVGENAPANDYLTTRVASPSDIWLHVRAATSAHGLIRAQNRPASVSPATLRQAAELVAARSEVKHSSLIPVDYTLKKYVRKPRKSAPGAVTYQNEKTIYVTGING